jgi:hypothetical protein
MSAVSSRKGYAVCRGADRTGRWRKSTGALSGSLQRLLRGDAQWLCGRCVSGDGSLFARVLLDAVVASKMRSEWPKAGPKADARGSRASR